MYHGYVPGVISLQAIRDGILCCTINAGRRMYTTGRLPMGTGTAVHVLFCLFSCIETFHSGSLFCVL